MKIDFFARRAHFVDHIAPVWKALKPELRGGFHVPMALQGYAVSQGLEVLPVRQTTQDLLSGAPNGPNPLLTCAYGDMLAAYKVRPQRPFILMEHGVGLTFNNPSYAGALGMRRHIAMFLVPNEHTRAMNARVLPMTPQAVIGTPKMDAVSLRLVSQGSTTVRAGSPPAAGRKPVVCISFHWNGQHIAPEAGNAFGHYAGSLAELARQDAFSLIGHGHPKFPQLEQEFRQRGVEFVGDFREVMERADVYVNDCSSTLYEFLVTGKPVVILNAPQFRRNVHQGIRFWEYADVGPQVNEPGQLLPAIQWMLAEPGKYRAERDHAVVELYPFPGEAADRAAMALEDFMQDRRPGTRKVDRIHGETVGIIYMCFGAKAAIEIRKSMLSLKNLGIDLPVTVIGDRVLQGADFIRWEGEDPFDATQRARFQFRAGRVKPAVCMLTPYDRTLYIDADTEFLADILPGFQLLDEYPIALAEELLTIGQLYNRPRAGWEINIQERDATIQELGIDPRTKFLNSGVIFYRKSPEAAGLFNEWSRQWLRWQQWDEQMALMRALHKCSVNYKVLSVDWNHPHRKDASIIFHNYGKGTARIDVK